MAGCASPRWALVRQPQGSVKIKTSPAGHRVCTALTAVGSVVLLVFQPKGEGGRGKGEACFWPLSIPHGSIF
jgi:hypothetical protein